MKSILALIVALLLAGCASDPDRRNAYIAGAGDCATTAGALMIGQGLVEGNPIGPVAACIAKPLVIEWAAHQPEPDRTQALHAVEAVWGAVVVNNLLQIGIAVSSASLPWMLPYGIGAVAGYVIWHLGSDEREYAAICAGWKQEHGAAFKCEPFGKQQEQ